MTSRARPLSDLDEEAAFGHARGRPRKSVGTTEVVTKTETAAAKATTATPKEA